MLRSSSVQIAGAAMALEPRGQLGELDGLGKLDGIGRNMQALLRPLLGADLAIGNLLLAHLLHGGFHVVAEALASKVRR